MKAWTRRRTSRSRRATRPRARTPTPARPTLDTERTDALKITLLADDRIRLDGGAGPMTIEAESAETSYSPFHMLASALATCTLSVLHAWATNAKLPADGLAVEVGWSFVEEPHRVGAMSLDVD